jgi:hypothetical protein
MALKFILNLRQFSLLKKLQKQVKYYITICWRYHQKEREKNICNETPFGCETDFSLWSKLQAQGGCVRDGSGKLFGNPKTCSVQPDGACLQSAVTPL